MLVSAVTDENLPAVRSFLDANAEMAMLLLSNLSRYGVTLGPAMNSGNMKCIQLEGQILAVFALTRRGTLLCETAGRTGFAQAILDACVDEPVTIQGVIGEWHSAHAIWELLQDSARIVESYRSRDTLYRLELGALADPSRDPSVRRLEPEDFAQWQPLIADYLAEEGLPVQGTLEERRSAFEEHAGAGRWWGYFDDGNLG